MCVSEKERWDVASVNFEYKLVQKNSIEMNSINWKRAPSLPLLLPLSSFFTFVRKERKAAPVSDSLFTLLQQMANTSSWLSPSFVMKFITANFIMMNVISTHVIFCLPNDDHNDNHYHLVQCMEAKTIKMVFARNSLAIIDFPFILSQVFLFFPVFLSAFLFSKLNSRQMAAAEWNLFRESGILPYSSAFHPPHKCSPPSPEIISLPRDARLYFFCKETHEILRKNFNFH